MKERSVSKRNFVGAFLGGILGILALGYLHPAVLPFGCFFGVVVGWWYQEIWQSVTESVRRGVTKTWYAWKWFTIFALTPTRKLREVQFNIGPYLKVFHFFVFLFVWLLRRPTVFIKWLQAHQMNRAYAVRALAVFTHLASNALWAVPLVIYCFKVTSSAPKDSWMPLITMLIIVIIPAFVVMTPITLWEENTPKMQKFYLMWEQYSAEGPGRLFLKDLTDLFRLEISFFLLVGGAFVWFTGIGGAFVLFVVVPISVAVGTVKGIYRVSTKAGHWLCFGTTTVVTAIVAWMTYPYLNDARILWIIALTAGLTSAIATEAIRRSLVLIFSNSKRASAVAINTLGSQLLSSGRMFWKITMLVNDKFRSVLPMSI